ADVTNSTAAFTYSGSPQGLTATVSGVGSDQLTINSITYDGSLTAPTNVKLDPKSVVEGTRVDTFNATQNYNQDSARATEANNKDSTTVKIFNGPADVTNSTAAFTYSGSPQGLTATVSGVGSDQLTINSITYDGSLTAPTNVK